MKKLLNYFLMLLVLVSMTGCEMSLIDNTSNDNLILNFRAIELEGAKLEVDVINNNVTIEHREKILSANENIVNFSFKLPSDKDVEIVAQVTKDGTILYSGTKKTTISKDKNPAIIMELVPKAFEVSLNVTLDTPITAETDGSEIKVYVNGKYSNKNKILHNGDSNTSLSIGTLKLGDKISAVIDKTIVIPGSDSTVARLYDSETIIVNSNTISLPLVTFKGRFIWSTMNKKDSNINYSFSSLNKLEDSFKPIYHLPNSSSKGPKDFSFDKNGNLWILNEDTPLNDSGSLISYTAVNEPYTQSTNPLIKYTTTDLTLSELELGEIHAIATLGDGLALIGVEANETMIQDYYIGYLTKSASNFTVKKLNITGQNIQKAYIIENQGLKEINNIPTAMITHGNNIYFVTNSEENLYKQVSLEGQLEQTSSKKSVTISKLEADITSNKISWVKTTTIGKTTDYITDLIFQDGYLYATVINYEPIYESDISLPVSKGNIYKIDPTSLKVIKEFGESAEPFVSFEKRNDFLVGPRKFVAIKPKKLIIADDGAGEINPGTESPYGSLKRFITIDLDSFMIEDVVEAYDLFDSSVEQGSFGKFTYKPNIY